MGFCHWEMNEKWVRNGFWSLRNKFLSLRNEFLSLRNEWEMGLLLGNGWEISFCILHRVAFASVSELLRNHTNKILWFLKNEKHFHLENIFQKCFSLKNSKKSKNLKKSKISISLKRPKMGFLIFDFFVQPHENPYFDLCPNQYPQKTLLYYVIVNQSSKFRRDFYRHNLKWKYSLFWCP